MTSAGKPRDKVPAWSSIRNHFAALQVTARITESKDMPSASILDITSASERMIGPTLDTCRSVPSVCGTMPCAIAARAIGALKPWLLWPRSRKTPRSIVSRIVGEHRAGLVEHPAGLGCEAVGDEVAGIELVEHLRGDRAVLGAGIELHVVVEFPQVQHQRQPCRVRDRLREHQELRAERDRDHRLQSTDHVTIRVDQLEEPPQVQPADLHLVVGAGARRADAAGGEADHRVDPGLGPGQCQALELIEGGGSCPAEVDDGRHALMDADGVGVDQADAAVDVQVRIDEARRNELAGRVDEPRAIGRQPGGDRLDLAVADADVEHRIQAGRGVDDAPAADHRIESHVRLSFTAHPPVRRW